MEINYDNFKETIKLNKPTLIKFMYTGCPPCVASQPMVDRLKEHYSKFINFGEFNIGLDEMTKQIARIYGVTVAPTFLLFGKGRLLDRFQVNEAGRLNEHLKQLCQKIEKQISLSNI